MPQDARNKLRQMGGITAAFPEMVQAFQEGGMPQAPVYGPAPATGSMGRALASDPIRELIESRGMGGGALQENPPAGLTRRDARNAPTPDPMTLGELVRGTVRAMPGALPSALKFGADLEPVATEERRPDPRASRAADVSAAERALEEARKQKLLEIYGPGSEGGPTRPEDRPGTRPRARPEDIAARATELLNISTDDTGDGDTPPTLRDTYNEELSLVMEVLGEDDKDAARDKALTLAMVGLAALTGPRGQLLQNLAEGALIGLSATGKRREKRRERERELKTFALQSAIDKQTARAQADAEAARMDRKLSDAIALEEAKAQFAADYDLGGGGSEDFPSPAEFGATERQRIREAITAGDLKVPENEDKEAFINRTALNNQLNYVSDLIQQGGSQGQIRALQRFGQSKLPRDPETDLPVVATPGALVFIAPGQSYIEFNPATGESVQKTKPE